MDDALLPLLRCPYCGTALTVVANSALARGPRGIDSGVLGCECCAFPVVAGIPVLVADDATRDVMHTLEAGRPDDALYALLGLDSARVARFRALVAADRTPTYRELLVLLCLDAEGDYLLHRFSDPTFVMIEALVRTLGSVPGLAPGRWLDVCAGAGHFSRVLRLAWASATGAEPRPAGVLADRSFWKLWLARRFIVPGGAAVCCNADHPLPFASAIFTRVLLADAFPYIWHKRLLASEIMRLTEPSGLIVLPHLHSAWGRNVSAGDTLSPTAYRDLLDPRSPRVFRDTHLLDDVLDHGVVDLSQDVSPADLGTEATLTLVAAPERAFRRREVPRSPDHTQGLALNPLYRVERHGKTSVLTLSFPTSEYEDEFGAVRRYLPERVTVDADLSGVVTPGALGARYAELRDTRVLLDLPTNYA